jgi:hypothetical protein
MTVPFTIKILALSMMILALGLLTFGLVYQKKTTIHHAIETSCFIAGAQDVDCSQFTDSLIATVFNFKVFISSADNLQMLDVFGVLCACMLGFFFARAMRELYQWRISKLYTKINSAQHYFVSLKRKRRWYSQFSLSPTL